MFTKQAAASAVAFAFALPFFTSASADVSLTYSNPDNSGQDMVLTVAGNRAAMVMPDDSGKPIRMVYDQPQDKIFLVMDEQQQYMDMDAMMETLGGLSSMLADAMKNVPEESKGQLGDLLGGMLGGNKAAEPAPAPAITRTGKTDEVAGINCTVVSMQAAGETSELCLAEPGDAGLSGSDFAILQGMMVKQAESARKAGEMLGVRGLEFSPGKLDGVPLRITQVTGQDAGTQSELKGVSDSVDQAVVDIPDNYQPASMMGG